MKLINIMIPLWKSPIDPDDPFVEVSYQATRGATRASAAAGTWAVLPVGLCFALLPVMQ